MIGYLTKPINDLINASKVISEGKYNHKIKIHMNDEIGELAKHFEVMRKKIGEKMISLQSEILKKVQVERKLSRILIEVNKTSDECLKISNEVNSFVAGISDFVNTQSENMYAISNIMSLVDSYAQNSTEKIILTEKFTVDAFELVRNGTGQMEDAAKSMALLEETSNKISNTMKVVNDISFQTNLLSLNAAVEAARAGKHGKSFAVVAEEVRKLAINSSVHANETSVVVVANSNQINQTLDKISKTSETLNFISKSIGGIVDLSKGVQEINSKQMSSFIEANEKVSLFGNLIEKHRSQVNDVTRSANNLGHQIKQLKGHLSEIDDTEKVHET